MIRIKYMPNLNNIKEVRVVSSEMASWTTRKLFGRKNSDRISSTYGKEKLSGKATIQPTGLECQKYTYHTCIKKDQEGVQGE